MIEFFCLSLSLKNQLAASMKEHMWQPTGVTVLKLTHSMLVGCGPSV